MLYQLKRAGISQLDLVTVYISVVRPVLEYACPVWHTKSRPRTISHQNFLNTTLHASGIRLVAP